MIGKLISAIKDEGFSGILYRFRWRYWRARLVISRSLKWRVIRSSYGVYLIEDKGDYTFFVNVVGGHGEFLSKKLVGMSEPFVFLDIGANQGLYSLIAAQNPLCTSVFSFEPVKHTMSFFRGNSVLNGVDDRITFVEKAISFDNAVQEIALISGHSGSGSLRSCTGPSYDKHYMIETMDGKELAEVMKGSNEPIFCKIDVEGHEPVVVEQLLSQPAISERLSALFIECDEDWFDVSVLMERLKSAGFNLEKVGRGNHFDLYASRAILCGN